MNHGITVRQLHSRPARRGHGRLHREVHLSRRRTAARQPCAAETLRSAGLEMVDVENLRPHYARTLWAWSDALEARLDEAQRVLADHRQQRRRGEGAARLSPVPGGMRDGLRAGLDRAAPDARDHARTASCKAARCAAHNRRIRSTASTCTVAGTMLYKFKSKAAGDLIMLEPNGRRVLEIIGKDAGPKGIILPEDMPGAIAALEAAIAREEADRKPWPKKPRPRARRRRAAKRVSLRQRAVPFLDMLRRCQKPARKSSGGCSTPRLRALGAATRSRDRTAARRVGRCGPELRQHWRRRVSPPSRPRPSPPAPTSCAPRRSAWRTPRACCRWGSRPGDSSFSLIAGVSSDLATSCWMRLTMSGGVPAGASRPNQELASKPLRRRRLLDRRHVGQGRRALRAGHRQRLELAGLDLRHRRRQVVEHHVHVAAQHAQQRRARAAVREVRHVHAGHALEQFARQVDRGAVAAGSHVELAGIGLGVLDEVRRRC